jgi:hypothetical protein
VVRFFLSIREQDGTLSVDSEGSEHRGLSGAREEALKAAREMIAERVKREGSCEDARIFEIRDASGVVLLRVPFQSAVRRQRFAD